MLDKAFVATIGPDGSAQSTFTPSSTQLWEERKADGSVAQWVDAGKSKTQGSTTVQLKGQLEGQAAVLLVCDTSIQVVAGGTYWGEFLGHWEGAGAPPLPSSLIHRVCTEAPPPSKAADLPVAPPVEAKDQKKTRPQKKKNCSNSPDEVEKLYQACKASDDFGVHKLLERPVDPDGISPSENQTPLMVATLKGSVRVVELLLKYGADVNKDVDGITAMIIAHQKGKKEILRILFAAAFAALESVVGGSNPTSYPVRGKKIVEELDDGMHWRELKNVTSKLAALNNRERDSDARSEIDQMSMYEESLPGEDSSDKLREDVVRSTMQALLRVSHHAR